MAFAQLLVATMLARRADDDLEGLLQDERYSRIARLLYKHQEGGIEELETATELPERELRTRLQELQLKGAINFRHTPTVSYFLTPLAMALVKAQLP